MKITKTAAYKKTDTGELCFDLYLPDTGAAPYPFLMFIHGGGWVQGDRRLDGGDIAGFFDGVLALGFAAVSVSYRLCGGGVAFPSPVDDCADAARFLRDNAAALGLDPARMAVSGVSAGGHLALMTAFASERFGEDGRAEPVSFRCVVDFCGPTDLLLDRTVRAQDATDACLDALFSNTPSERRRSDAELASPIFHARRLSPDRLPPLLAVQGQEDELVHRDHSELLLQVYAEKGAKFEIIRVENGNHGFGPVEGLLPPSPDMAHISRTALSFLKKHL